MIKIKTTNAIKQFSCIMAAATLLFAYFPTIASASPISNRSVAIGSSVASANTTYTFNFTVPSATVVRSASFTACTTASGACTPAPGFSASSSTLASQPTNLGDASGWTVDTTTVNALKLKKTANAAAPTGSQTVSFANVINPSATNSTFYIRMTTFSADDYTGAIDDGVVASSTAGQVTVSVVIDESLSFTLDTSSVSLTTPTVASTGSGTSQMTLATNAKNGYSVGYNGDTLKSGSNSITPMTAGGASTVNSNQFGLNLVSNTTPAVGLAVSGTGTGTPATGYGTANQFKFSIVGDTIASASLPTNTNTFTTSYIVNMNGSAAAGVYSTILTYTATANF